MDALWDFVGDVSWAVDVGRVLVLVRGFVSVVGDGFDAGVVRLLFVAGGAASFDLGYAGFVDGRDYAYDGLVLFEDVVLAWSFLGVFIVGDDACLFVGFVGLDVGLVVMLFVGGVVADGALRRLC